MCNSYVQDYSVIICNLSDLIISLNTRIHELVNTIDLENTTKKYFQVRMENAHFT